MITSYVLNLYNTVYMYLSSKYTYYVTFVRFKN